MKKNILSVFLMGAVSSFILFSGCGSTPSPEDPAAVSGDDVWALLEYGETEKARAFFLGKTDVNAVDSRGRTPLHLAAERKDPDLAAFFISLGARVEALDNDNRSPLVISAEKQDDSVARVLCAAGADIHVPMSGGSSPAMTGIAVGGDFLRALLSPSSIVSIDFQGRTILHLAAQAGNPAAVETILRIGEYAPVRDRDGKTALDFALARSDSAPHMEAAEKLILAGAYSESPLFGRLAPAVRSSNYNIRDAGGSTVLHYAAGESCLGLITFLAGKQADVNAKNASGSTPLHEAARTGNIKTMELLLSLGADVNAQDAKGNTPLHLAIPPALHQEAAALFLSRGANPNLRDAHGDSPLHVAITLNRDTGLIQTLLSGNAEVSIRNIDGKTPLYLAVEENRAGAVPLLLSYGSDIFAADNEGITPYERALRDKSSALPSLITPDTVMKMDSAGNTLLHISIRYHAGPAILGLILDQKALVNTRNREGDTGLHLAVRQNEEESGTLLLTRGADIFAPNAREESPLYLAFHSPGGIRTWMISPLTLEAKDGLGNGILHYAAQWKLDSHIPYIIKQGADMEQANATGETPLFTAAKYDGASTVNTLLASGASFQNRDTMGNSALHTAVRWGAKNAAAALLDAGIDINAHALNGKTPLHNAVYLGLTDLINLLVSRGASLEVRDNEGNTPFMEAVMAGLIGQADRLAETGANPVTRNIRGDTPLHIAVSTEKIEMVNLLLGMGAQIHAKNSLGKTPFQLALGISPRMVSTLLTKDRLYAPDDFGASPLTIAVRERASSVIIQTIISQGAGIDTVDSEGRTPLRLAVERDSWDLAKILADAGADPFISAGDNKSPAELALSKGGAAIRAVFSGKAIHARDGSGNTILHYAAKEGGPGIVALLLELGANKSTKNIAAESPADIARRWNKAENAALLN